MLVNCDVRRIAGDHHDTTSVSATARIIAGRENGVGQTIMLGQATFQRRWHLMGPHEKIQSVGITEFSNFILGKPVSSTGLTWTASRLFEVVCWVIPEQLPEDVAVGLLRHRCGVDEPAVVTLLGRQLLQIEGCSGRSVRQIYWNASVYNTEPRMSVGDNCHRWHHRKDELVDDVEHRCTIFCKLAFDLIVEAPMRTGALVLVVSASNKN
mmetsp:Transcript_11267/g.21118  ORF Transcript_11267/g.21118 Transcript_11267/m.21118 type:complete len:210 (+) Transcript_11267:184-813(+)